MSRMDWTGISVVCLWLVTWNCPASAFTPNLPVDISEHFHNETTQGQSGVKCTGIKRRCLAGLQCVDKHCVCPDGTKGNGEIECVDEDKLLCVVSADPHMTSFEQAHVDVDLPCRYRLTRYVTGHRGAATPHAFCSVEVYATNELNRGQYYVRSVHISLGITDSGKQVHHQFEVRKFGVTDDEIFLFLANVTKTRTVWGFSQHETINGVDVFPTYDEVNNFAILYVPECDTRIKYRVYDRSRHRQRLLPGVTIMAPSNLSFLAGYGHYPHSLCGTDKDDHTLYTQRAQELGLDSKDLAIIYDILNEEPPQHGNPKKAECDAAIQVFKDSPNQVEDLNFCGHICSKTKTRKCTIAAGYQPINLFTICFDFRTTGNATACNTLKTVAEGCGNKWKGHAIVC